MATVQRVETDREEHDRLRAQRERIARIYGHQPKQPARVMAVTSADCVGHSVPLTKNVTPPPYAVRKQLRETTLAVGREVRRG